MHLMRLCLGLMVCAMSGLALADCRAVAKLQSAQFDDDKITLVIRVHASQPKYSRTVFYSVFGDYKGQLTIGNSTMRMSLYQSGTATVSAGDEYVDDELEILPGAGSVPIETPRVKQILVTGCYTN